MANRNPNRSGAIRSGLISSALSLHSKLLSLEGNLFNQGYPDEAANVQWACVQLDLIIHSLKKKTKERNKI